jgi:hypothetical protein
MAPYVNLLTCDIFLYFKARNLLSMNRKSFAVDFSFTRISVSERPLAI